MWIGIKTLYPLLIHSFTSLLKREPESEQRGDHGRHRIDGVGESEEDAEQAEPEAEEKPKPEARMVS